MLLSVISCGGETHHQKDRVVKESISQEVTEIDSIQRSNEQFCSKEKKFKAEKLSIVNQIKSSNSIDNPGDSILGIWEVKNVYNMAIYEIVKFKDQYFAKIHYYNDGKREIKAQMNEEDYFLDGIYYKNGKYTMGKMYMPDGKQYQSKFILNGDNLKVKMSINGYSYTEDWKRKP